MMQKVGGWWGLSISQLPAPELFGLVIAMPGFSESINGAGFELIISTLRNESDVTITRHAVFLIIAFFNLHGCKVW